jgi:hypothetical protein
MIRSCSQITLPPGATSAGTSSKGPDSTAPSIAKGRNELLDEYSGSLSLGDEQLVDGALDRTGTRYHPSFWRNAEEFLLARSAAKRGAD